MISVSLGRSRETRLEKFIFFIYRADILEHERIIDFHRDDDATTRYLRHFELGDLAKRGRLYANANDAIFPLFAAGVGFAALTQEVARPHLESGALIALNGAAAVESPMALAWYPRPGDVEMSSATGTRQAAASLKGRATEILSSCRRRP